MASSRVKDDFSILLSLYIIPCHFCPLRNPLAFYYIFENMILCYTFCRCFFRSFSVHLVRCITKKSSAVNPVISVILCSSKGQSLFLNVLLPQVEGLMQWTIFWIVNKWINVYLFGRAWQVIQIQVKKIYITLWTKAQSLYNVNI